MLGDWFVEHGTDVETAWSGAVPTRETTWSLAQLEALTSVTRDYALECTGNARRLYDDQQGTPRPGTQWALGAIGLAGWTGVPLCALLHHAVLRTPVDVRA